MTEFKKVLVIDDDPTQLAIMSAYFGSLRAHDIMTALDGIEAIQIMDTDGDFIDIVVCDLSMPHMDGLEFLRYLMEIEYRGKVAIISGLEEALLENAGHVGRMHGLDMVGTVKKPLTKSALDAMFLSEQGAEMPGNVKHVKTIGRTEISDALKNGAIVPYYQPKMDLLSGKIIGAEALARWHAPGNRTISPAEFIPAAEKLMMIEELTFVMFSNVMADIRKFGERWNEMKISINLPPAMISHTSLPNRLKEMFRKENMDSSMFCLEVTESGITAFDTDTIEVLSRLRIMGFDLSIDDFGTGASNISNLRMFPYSEMKIDQSFINNIETDAFSSETVRASISLARQLDMRIVAEGVESKQILEFLKARGIDQAQGYYIAKPMPAEEMDAFLASGGVPVKKDSKLDHKVA